MIRKLSILESTLVRDLFAWLRLIVAPADNVACARVLAAPYWGLEPRDLVRLAERAEKNHRRPLCDELETAQNEAPFNRHGVKLNELVATAGALAPKRATKLCDGTRGRIDRRLWASCRCLRKKIATTSTASSVS